MGNIGRTVAEIFYGGFNAKLIAYDAFLPEDAWSHLPHTRAKSAQEVIEQADMLTLHIPLTEETRNMLSYTELKQMKPDAILINAARGGIVNEDDLTRVLSEGHLWGAGLDCHEQEPPSAENYGTLWDNLNVVSTPHIGAATNTAQRASSMTAINNLHRYLCSLDRSQ
jgi:phosphoglycerate dehydrogenase-like enzyme